MAQHKVGLIGCGSIALSAHLPALAQLQHRAKLSTACDIREDVARQTAQQWEADSYTADYREVLADPQIDVVIITTPEFLHAEQVIAAAEAGKQILCEKPISATLPEADAMIDAAERAGVLLLIAHSRRFTRRYRQVREILDSGAIGQPVLVRENERRPRAQYSVLNLPVDIWRPDDQDDRDWKDIAQYAGGVARGHAIHEMDLFRWFAGAECTAITAEHKITVPGREVADAISIQVEFDNGVLAGCDLYSQAPSGYPYFHQLEIIGDEGRLSARDTDMITMTRFDGQGMSYPNAYSSLLHITDAYVLEQRLFFDAIEAGSDPPLDPRDARAALEMALAATHSAETGARVDLPFVEPSNGGDAS